MFTRENIAKSIHEIISGYKVSIGELPYQPYDVGRWGGLLEALIEYVENDIDGVTPEDIHDKWVSWAEQHDPLHASIIPFDEMSDTEKIKDWLVLETIKAHIAYGGIDLGNNG